MADDQAEIVRLLESINGRGPAEFFRLWVHDDATEWVERIIRSGASIGLGLEVTTPIIFDALNEIRAAVALVNASSGPAVGRP